MKILQKDGKPINNFVEWENYFVSIPRNKGKWKKGYSAQELANCWTTTPTRVTIVPKEYIDILKSHKDTNSYYYNIVIPECPTNFDNRRFPREHDLLISCNNDIGDELIIGVEAKVLETFGDTLDSKEKQTLNLLITKPTSQAHDRLVDLSETLLNIDYKATKFSTIRNGIKAGDLRYQLLTGLAGVLAEMANPNPSLDIKKPLKCIFLIHQLISKNATPNELSKIAKNKKDLDNFTTFLFNMKLTTGILEGSYKIVGSTKSASTCLKFKTPIEFYIGYIETFF